jgi:hypothetical protein
MSANANDPSKQNPAAATIENIGQPQEVDPALADPAVAQPDSGIMSAVTNVGAQIQDLIANTIAPAVEKATAAAAPDTDDDAGAAAGDNIDYGPSPEYAPSPDDAGIVVPLKIAKDSYSEWSSHASDWSFKTRSSSSPLDKPVSFNNDSEASFYVEHEDEMTDYYEAIDSYYSYKEHYENSKTAIKNNINANHSDVSWRQKRNLYRKTRPACINCKRKVGTVFATEYVEDKVDPNNIDKTARILKARCGDDKDPCTLDIQIMIPYTVMFEKIFENNKKLIRTMQKMIIEEKNNAIFGYTERNAAVQKFQTINNQLSSVIKDDEYVSLLFEYIANNSKKTKQLEETHTAFYANINILRDYIAEYEKTNDEQSIVDAVTLYNDEILPELEQIASLKFMHQSVEFDNNTTFHLVQQEVNLPNRVYSSLDTARIVKYVVDNENIVPKKKSGLKSNLLIASSTSSSTSNGATNASSVTNESEGSSVGSN